MQASIYDRKIMNKEFDTLFKPFSHAQSEGFLILGFPYFRVFSFWGFLNIRHQTQQFIPRI